MTLFDSINWNELARQILLDEEAGSKIHVFKNGTIEKLSSSESLHPDDLEGCVAVLKTPGIGNLNSNEFTNGFVSWNEEIESYVVTGEYHEDQGRIVGQLEDVIEECIIDGDITPWIEQWKKEIKQYYYVIVNTYVGPRNDYNFDWENNPEDGELVIQTTPGCKNLSGEKCSKGWLGNTNDNHSHAFGEFSTLEDAQKKANELGYTEVVEGPDDYLDDDIIETRRTKKGTLDHWQASDWLRNNQSAEEVAESLGLTKKATDEDILKAVEDVEQEASDHNIVLINTEEAIRNTIEDLE